LRRWAYLRNYEIVLQQEGVQEGVVPEAVREAVREAVYEGVSTAQRRQSIVTWG
jgi:hypothetical protein